MNKLEKSGQLRRRSAAQAGFRNPDAVRRRETRRRAETRNSIPYARQIAEQFRDGTYSPAMIIGLMRLFEFLALFAIGYAIQCSISRPATAATGSLMRAVMAAIVRH